MSLNKFNSGCLSNDARHNEEHKVVIKLACMGRQRKACRTLSVVLGPENVAKF